VLHQHSIMLAHLHLKLGTIRLNPSQHSFV